MKILMLSWEYPPKCVGGLSNHVYHLAKSLAYKGNEVHVLTSQEGDAPAKEINEGVFIHRVSPYKIETEDFVKWVMQLNFAMIEYGTRLMIESGKFDIIHAHDWLTAFAAKSLKGSFKVPMVSTIHATEHGRNGGIRTDMQRYIASAEWMLSYESWKIVACSNYMRQQIGEQFKSPLEKIWVIPNGISLEDFKFEFNELEYRRRFALDDEKILFFIGRHVFEKGIHLLVEALPQVIKKYGGNIKVVIAGTGAMSEELNRRSVELGIKDRVIFTGYMNDIDRNKMYRVANIAVFPSLYEPFGIVALEAMAGGCPVVVSNTGGLGEIINHKFNGMKVIAGSIDSLALNIIELLSDEDMSERIVQNGYSSLSEHYSWDSVADLTCRMYDLVKIEASGTEWEIQCTNSAKEVSSNEVEVIRNNEELVTLEAVDITTHDSSTTVKKGASKRGRVKKEQKIDSNKETALDAEKVSDSKDDEVKPKRKRKATSVKSE